MPGAQLIHAQFLDALSRKYTPEYDIYTAPHPVLANRTSMPGPTTPRRYRKKRNQHPNISTAGLRRMARRGGVKRIGTHVYPEIRNIMREFIETTIQDALRFTQHGNRKTVMAADIIYALKLRGRTLYGFDTVGR